MLDCRQHRTDCYSCRNYQIKPNFATKKPRSIDKKLLLTYGLDESYLMYQEIYRFDTEIELSDDGLHFWPPILASKTTGL